jgi:hypothetical protein
MSPYVTAIRSELTRHGVTDYEFQRGGKHPRVLYSVGERRLMYVFPGSTSDSRRGVKNAIAGIRRQIGVGT